MRTVSLVVISLVLLTSFAFAQDVVPAVSAGSKAVLFDFSGLSFLGAGAYEGGFGAKYFLSSDLAVRAGVLFANASDKIPANPGPGQAGTDGERSATQFGVLGGVEWHPGKGRVSPYMGVGAGISLTSTEHKTAVIAPTVQTTTKNDANGETLNNKTYYGATALGVYGLVGVEFFLYKELSLGAEYRVGLTSSSKKDEEVSAGSLTQTTKGGSYTEISIMNTGTITLAVYF